MINDEVSPGREIYEIERALEELEQRQEPRPPGDSETGQFTGKKKAGRLLDGREWNQMPEVG